MQAEGVICHYGMGGAVGAALDSEPATTLEIEVLAIPSFDPNDPSGSPIAPRNYLIEHGYKTDGECFESGGWPVRLFVANNNLERAAVASSLPVDVDSERTWVIMAEHLMAIALVADRPSDKPWMLRLTESDAIDELTLKSILSSHDLIGKWAKFTQEYPPQFPSKQMMRQTLAALSFSEKIKILEKLRDRSRAIAGAGLRRP